MTCEHVTDRLLETASGEWADLQPHLDQCPRCRALALRIQDDEASLAEALEDFVSAPIPDLPQADEPRLRWGRAIQGLGLVAAIAAVLVLAVVPVEPGADADLVWDQALGSPVLYAAEDATQAYFELMGEPVVLPAGDDRAAVDGALTGALKGRANALQEASDALAQAAESEDPTVQVVALHDLGEVHRTFGSWLRDMPHPPYLSDKQHRVYQMALDDKAAVQDAKALEAWAKGRGIALEQGLDAEAAALEALIAEVEAERQAALPPPPGEADLARVAGEVNQVVEGCVVPLNEGVRLRARSQVERLTTMGGEDTPEGIERRLGELRQVRIDVREACLSARIDRVEGWLDAMSDCLAPESVSEIEVVLAQAQQWVDAESIKKGEPSMYGDIDQFLAAYEDATEQALASCEPTPNR